MFKNPNNFGRVLWQNVRYNGKKKEKVEKGQGQEEGQVQEGEGQQVEGLCEGQQGKERWQSEGKWQ